MLTYSNVVATAALLLAIGTGSAVAVNLVTGDQVADGSLTGRDIKNRSMAARKLVRIPAPATTVREGPEGHLECANGCPGIQTVTAQAADCRRKEVALGGGVSLAVEPGKGAVTASVPVHRGSGADRKPVGWTGSGWVEVAAGTAPVSVPLPHAWVICARAQ